MTTRLPPHSPEGERALVGAVLQGGRATLDEVVAAGVTPDWFYDMRARSVWSAFLALPDDQHVNTISVSSVLSGTIPIDWISSCEDACPAAATASHWVDLLRAYWLRRTAIRIATDVINKAYDCGEDPAGVLDKLHEAVIELGTQTTGHDVITAQELAEEAIAAVEAIGQGGDVAGTVKTYHDRLDRRVSLEPGTMTLIAARPSVGKTALALDIALRACERGKKIGLISLEMPRRQIGLRILARLSAVSIAEIRHRQLTPADFEAFTQGRIQLGKMPFFLVDLASATVSRVKAYIRKLRSRYGVELVFVDYLQLIHGDGKFQNRENEVADVCSNLKASAKQLELPVVVLSQLNRESDKGKPRMPRLSDLRESGRQEADADAVILMHREEAEAVVEPITLNVAKNRNGPVGLVSMLFNKPIGEFNEVDEQT